jgi:hypothetical protein
MAHLLGEIERDEHQGNDGQEHEVGVVHGSLLEFETLNPEDERGKQTDTESPTFELRRPMGGQTDR